MATIFTSFIVLPFAWFAVKINKFSLENKSDDFIFPQFSQFWITALSGLIFFIIKRASIFLRPITLKYVMTHDYDDGKVLDEEERANRAKKIETHLIEFIFYFVSSVAGIYVCMD